MLKLLLAAVIIVGLGVGAANAQTTAYVKSEVANERSGPGTQYPVQNKVYVGQQVTIYERQNGWARVTAPQYTPRWISESLLSTTKPNVVKGFTLPPELKRADLAGLAAEPETNLNGDDVIALRRFGAHLLDTKQCRSIEYGDESVNNASQIYIMCNGYVKKTATKSDWLK